MAKGSSEVRKISFGKKKKGVAKKSFQKLIKEVEIKTPS